MTSRGAAILGALLVSGPAHAAGSFTDIGAGLTGLFEGSAAWGDYDNDGDLDIAAAGRTAVGGIARIYRNDAGVFALTSALPAGAAVTRCALGWADFDRDGDLDLAISGDTGAGTATRVYRNDAGVLADIAAGLEGLRDGGLAWADVDNDGDPDLVVTGENGSVARAHLYRNDAGSFVDAAAGVASSKFSCLACADVDLDGDIDLLVAGVGTTSAVTTLYQNTAGVFAPIATALPAMQDCGLDWADREGDGDPDIALSGSFVSEVWSNMPGGYSNTGSVLQSVSRAALAWGDYDNDGFPDLALAGFTASVGFTAIYHNNLTSFTDISAAVPGMKDGALAWGDYDNDGDLDLMVAGASGQGSLASHRIYRNDSAPNVAPTAPSGLSVTWTATTVTFHWNAGADGANPASSLSYNLWAGTSPGVANVMAPMADLATGRRRVPQVGNAGQNLSWTLARSAFAGDHVYWGVQSIDQAFAGSPFATGPSGTLDVGQGPASSDLRVRLAGANPSRGETRLVYTLPRAARVDLAVIDVTGRRVRTLVAGERTAGDHDATWSGQCADGTRAAPGLYFVRLDAGGERASVRLLRIE